MFNFPRGKQRLMRASPGPYELRACARTQTHSSIRRVLPDQGGGDGRGPLGHLNAHGYNTDRRSFFIYNLSDSLRDCIVQKVTWWLNTKSPIRRLDHSPHFVFRFSFFDVDYFLVEE